MFTSYKQEDLPFMEQINKDIRRLHSLTVNIVVTFKNKSQIYSRHL